MNTDIRITINLPQHRKTKKLVRRAGESAFRCLIELWCSIAMNDPEGQKPLSVEDIELTANWQGEEGVLGKALVESGFFEEQKETGMLLPNSWTEHQPYASKSNMRSKQAQNAAELRWKRKRNIVENADSNAQSMNTDAQSIKNDADSIAPLPVPLPLPSPVPFPAIKICNFVQKFLIDNGFKMIDPLKSYRDGKVQKLVDADITLEEIKTIYKAMVAGKLKEYHKSRLTGAYWVGCIADHHTELMELAKKPEQGEMSDSVKRSQELIKLANDSPEGVISR